MFPTDLIQRAQSLVEVCRTRGIMLASAESCTGGLVAALITEIAGSSAVFDRGFVTYSNEAKQTMLGVPEAILQLYGAVSKETALAMASGAVGRSRADIAVSVTGIAGPGGGSEAKPVGLVHFACHGRHGFERHVERRFGPLTRAEIRLAAVDQAMALLEAAVTLTT